MNSNNFFSALPGFVTGVHALQSELIGAAFVISFAGLMTHVVLAMLGRNLAGMFGSLVRLALIPIIILSIQTWGDTLVTAVQGLTTDMGANGAGGNVFEAYQAAIARKLGTQSAASNFNQANQNVPIGQVAQPGQAVPSSLPGPGLQSNGVKLTSFGYAGDLTPDSNSSRGIGAFGFDSTPGSLISGYSAALSPDLAKSYNVQPGQQFTVTSTTGQSYTLQYADVTGNDPTTGAPLTGRVDIYDSSGQLGGNNFEQSVSSLNGGPQIQGQTGPAQMLPNPGGSIGDQVLWAITLGMSWVAGGVMFLMTIAQQILYLIEVAISPIFISCLMVPSLAFLARKFFLTLVGITLWPLSWAVCNLVTMALINFAVNPTGNSTIGSLNAASAVTGPLAGVAYLLVIAVWVIGSTLASPLFIGVLLGSGGGATSAVFGATLGAAAMRGIGMSAGPLSGAATSVIGNIGGNQSNPVSAASASRINSASSSASKRPAPSKVEA